MVYIGNIELLQLPKTAFLSSRNISPQSVIACYDWATQQRSAGRCVISGFHSQLEKDVLRFLLKGKQPLILVLGRSLYKKTPEEFIKPLEENRLLMVSVVSQTTNRQSVESAMIRNKYIIENADEVVLGSLDPKGMLYQLYLEIKSLNKHIIL
jgi:predicted Rossmann fold nucleotide-binding protein DprA/Smf involved in DNA uptake